MPILVTRKFEEDPIKNEAAILSTTFFLQRSRGRKSKVNQWMWPEFQFVRDFMAVLVNCKFDDDLMKN